MKKVYIIQVVSLSSAPNKEQFPLVAYATHVTTDKDVAFSVATAQMENMKRGSGYPPMFIVVAEITHMTEPPQPIVHKLVPFSL